MANAFWCIVEDDRQGTPKKVMAEVIGEAARLSSGQAEAVWFTDKATEAGLKQLAEWGANKVWLLENAAFAPYRSEIWTGAAAELAAKATPRAILAPVTSRQREFVARLAARLGVGLAADCVAFAMDGDELVATRPVYAGKLLAKVTWAKAPWIATLRPNVFRPAEAQPGRLATVERPSVATTVAQMRFVERREEVSTGLPELTEAEIVLSGGRGMKGPEHYVILEDMARVIGAAVGASRAAVDAGWRPHRFQIGQTGRTIPPKLYMGFGVSGAIQQLAGMSANNSLYCDPVSKFGTDAQRERFLRPAAAGHALGGFALTEPQAGSDARNQQTLAVRDGGHYVLNGRKQFVTNGREAAFVLVFCATDRAKAHRGITALVVEKGTTGFLVPKTEDKLGIRASDTAELVFEDCRVPTANRLGEEGMGFKIALATLDGGRVGIAAQAVGLAAGAFERSVAYARERKSFGVAIGQHQMVQWMLADMATAIDGARLLTLRAAGLKDKGRPYTTAAAMAKLFAAETAMKVTTDAVQVHGGYGFIKDYEVERYFRDAKITQIYEGTSQIQKLVIARAVLGGTE